MIKDLQNYIIKKTNEMISYDFCCADLKVMANRWLISIGTDNEPQAFKDYIAEIEDCLMPVDGLIEFAESERCAQIFGDKQKDEIAHAYKLKADGVKHCDCPVCKAGLSILEKKAEILE
ncbi:MAG: molecular chaperone Hsp90 [Eubacterium sp.]|nr:molecular chaperone Hsp90 [Eubacterium sp.]